MTRSPGPPRGAHLPTPTTPTTQGLLPSTTQGDANKECAIFQGVLNARSGDTGVSRLSPRRMNISSLKSQNSCCPCAQCPASWQSPVAKATQQAGKGRSAPASEQTLPRSWDTQGRRWSQCTYVTQSTSSWERPGHMDAPPGPCPNHRPL